MAAQDLSKISYRELVALSEELNRQIMGPFSLFRNWDSTSAEGIANAEIDRRLEVVQAEIERRGNTDEAASYWAEKHKAAAIGHAAAEAAHERQYADDPAYKARVDAAWQEWARLERVEGEAWLELQNNSKRIGDLELKVGQETLALMEEYKANLVDLAYDTQMRINNYALSYEYRLIELKYEIESRLPSLKMNFKDRVRAVRFRYKDQFYRLDCEYDRLFTAYNDAVKEKFSGIKMYRSIIGDVGDAFTPRTTK
ncbi:hypothetical protein [Bosea sp. NBC_00550]|uniref:hypothetical protein n=1 Tax=Bosea sp. NBC_00550 TaxID=2969621 RepID=UPI00222FAA67|nr:hypothetical protein [Bosea sp. NBC_00550]UZF92066.1 hypothetical protein NWE53_23750 [Bosea sp. NBC_00550]